MECSERSCNDKAIREVTIHAESQITDKKYKIWIRLCPKHYELEKKAGSIIDEVKKLR